MLNTFVSLFLVLGALFVLFAALGLIRMPDFFCRVQSVTKGTTLGIGFLMIAVAAHFHEGAGASRALVVVLFFFATSPIAGHMLSRAAYLMGQKKHNTVDGMADHPAWKDHAPTKLEHLE